jgi:hypothetical protein
MHRCDAVRITNSVPAHREGRQRLAAVAHHRSGTMVPTGGDGPCHRPASATDVSLSSGALDAVAHHSVQHQRTGGGAATASATDVSLSSGALDAVCPSQRPTPTTQEASATDVSLSSGALDAVAHHGSPTLTTLGALHVRLGDF